MTESDRVNKGWERIEKWFSENIPETQLPDGAGAVEIQALEIHLNVTLPEGLKASLRRHDGSPEGLWPKGSLFSVNGIKARWDRWAGLVENGAFAEFNEDNNEGRLQACWWCTSWVPIDADGAGNGTCVDLKPGENGTLGQVIDMDHEVGPNGPIFKDYPAYLEDIAMKLESGKYKNNDGYLEEDY